MTSEPNPIAEAAELLLAFSVKVGRPLMMAMQPPGNSLGLQPGQLKPSKDKTLHADCDGLVIAVACSPSEAQELAGLINQWQKQRGKS